MFQPNCVPPDDSSVAPSRPVVRWHGGKWLLAPWVIGHFAQHKVYVEPFGGGGSVLMQKPRSHGEVYNDLDGQVVNLFRVLRDDEQAARFARLLRLTPYARAEFNLSYEDTDDPVEWARRLVVRSFMGFGSDGHNPEVTTGFRAKARRNGTTPSRDWQNYAEIVNAFTRRLQSVVIECRDACEVMLQQDEADTLFYLDPPYLPGTRSEKSRRGKIRYHAYTHEMTFEQHVALLEFIRKLDGMVAISGYPAPIYDEKLIGWRKTSRKALADGARERTECMWINPQLQHALGHGPLFGVRL